MSFLLEHCILIKLVSLQTNLLYMKSLLFGPYNEGDLYRYNIKLRLRFVSAESKLFLYLAKEKT